MNRYEVYEGGFLDIDVKVTESDRKTAVVYVRRSLFRRVGAPLGFRHSAADAYRCRLSCTAALTANWGAIVCACESSSRFYLRAACALPACVLFSALCALSGRYDKKRTTTDKTQWEVLDDTVYKFCFSNRISTLAHKKLAFSMCVSSAAAAMGGGAAAAAAAVAAGGIPPNKKHLRSPVRKRVSCFLSE
jgi:hypothetical protein